jgi:hypothetical protein
MGFASLREARLDLDAERAETFFASLQNAGLGAIPGEFSVALQHQVVSRAALAEIAEFIQLFDRITAREAWRAAVRREAPAIARLARAEVCFFSAWDFHLPPEGGWRLIEFNDNGSGLLLAAFINFFYYETAGLAQRTCIEPPASIAEFERRVIAMVEQETRRFFGEAPTDLFLILDDAESLREGKFRRELGLLCGLFRRQAWRTALGCPEETRWDGRRLLFDGQAVGFVVNRSTDFLWESEEFSALRDAYEAGAVYVAPNPATYSTRSDKRLLEWLSLPQWDDELGIQPEERRILSAHVPETHVLRGETIDMLARRKSEFVFKPLHGFAGRGLLDSAAVGRSRLKRLVSRHEGYVAQKWVPKTCLDVAGATLWTDLRVWAYRGEIFLLSGRASRRLDRLDLGFPGGWLATYRSL